jgi:signal transduction histidine kinase
VTEEVMARRALEAAQGDARVAREAAESAQHDAEQANRAKSEFLAVMSHELRTPLNAIGGYAELMQLGIHGPVTNEQLVALERIQRSQRHLLGLINGVLNYSRVEAGVVHYEIGDVPLEETLATCEALIAPQLRAKRLEFVNHACPPDTIVRADREKLQQVVLNLLSNSVKFTDSGGRVELRCVALPNGMMSVRVRDTGRGIPAEQLERVFHPFVQVEAGLTRTHDGVGLGLAISRDLARGMGGDLTVESEPGRGSTFTLAVPLAEPAAVG